MSEQARVEDIESFRVFRVALHQFALIAEQSLTSVQAHVDRTRSWLETEQRLHWDSQLRRRSEAVVQARDAVRQKRLYKDASGRTPSAIEEEKVLRRCLASVEEAEAKILAVKRSIPRLDKESELYRGGVAPLSRAICDDIPRAIALLDRLADSLEEYVRLEASHSLGPVASDVVSPTADISSASELSMSRGGDQESPEFPSPATPESGAKGGEDVHDGK